MKIKDIVKSLSDERWNIGFISNDLNSIMLGEPIKVNWLKHYYKDSWFADPFILDVTDEEIIVLVEEWYKPIKRGRISKLTIDSDYCIRSCFRLHQWISRCSKLNCYYRIYKGVVTYSSRYLGCMF